VYGGRGNDIVAGGDGNDHVYGGSDSDQVKGGNGNDRVSGNRGDDAVSGNEGNDSLFGGWGADRAFGGSGNDELHALAPDGEPDLLNCGPGNDKAWVLRAERPRTQLVGCEKVYVVDVLTPDQDEGENSDADTEADS
jgi:Ca2+-binding RTX toxin-like protein